MTYLQIICSTSANHLPSYASLQPLQRHHVENSSPLFHSSVNPEQTSGSKEHFNLFQILDFNWVLIMSLPSSCSTKFLFNKKIRRRHLHSNHIVRGALSS